MRFFATLASAACCFLFSSPTAKADTLETFYLSAVFQTQDTVSGTLVFDVSSPTIGTIVGADVTSTGFFNGTWNTVGVENGGHGTTELTLSDGNSKDPTFELQIASGAYGSFLPPTPTSQVTLCSTSSPCQNYFSEFGGGPVESGISTVGTLVTNYATAAYIGPNPNAAPEISASGSVAGMAVLIGSCLVAQDRRRRSV